MRLPILVAALLLLASCAEQPKKPVNLSETLPSIPVPPNGEVVSSTGGADASTIRFRTPVSVEAAAGYYRGLLSQPPWTLVSDSRSQDGGIALYAEQQGPSMWVTITAADDKNGTFVDVSGAKSRQTRP